MPSNGGSTVECLTSATTPTPPAGIVDVCGLAVSPVLDSTIDSPASLTCEGTRTYHYSFTDCAGLVSTWKYIYTIDRTIAPAISGANVIVGTSPFHILMWVFIMQRLMLKQQHLRRSWFYNHWYE